AGARVVPPISARSSGSLISSATSYRVKTMIEPSRSVCAIASPRGPLGLFQFTGMLWGPGVACRSAHFSFHSVQLSPQLFPALGVFCPQRAPKRDVRRQVQRGGPCYQGSKDVNLLQKWDKAMDGCGQHPQPFVSCEKKRRQGLSPSWTIPCMALKA